MSAVTTPRPVAASDMPMPVVTPWYRTFRGLVPLAAFVIAVIVPFLVSDYDLFNLTRVLAIAFGVAGLNLLVGYSGQISVGHGAIFGIGGYTTILLISSLGIAWPLALLLGVVACIIVGLVIGIPALKLGGINLGLFTIAIAAIFPLLINRFSDLTGGTVGVALRGSPFQAEALGLTSAQVAFLVSLVLLAVTLVLLRNITTGRFNRAYAAIRTNPILAVANGVEIGRLKLIAFVVSSAVAGLGGGLLVLLLTLAAPDSFLLTFSLILLMACTVGGNRSWLGAIAGSAIVVYLPDFASDFISGPVAGLYAQLVFAVLLTVCLLFAPGGLAAWADALLRRFSSRRRGAPATLPTAYTDPTAPPSRKEAR